MEYEGYQDAILKMNGKAIFSYRMHFLKSGHTVALDAVEVIIEVL